MTPPARVGPAPRLDHAGLEILSDAECLERLAASPIGRLAFIDHGAPVILPVAIGLWEGSIVFTTAQGSKLDAAVANAQVALEVDGWDPGAAGGWSVLVKGVAHRIEDGREIASLDRLAVKSWPRPDQPKAWVMVVPGEMTGRRILQPTEPAKGPGA